MHSEPCLPSNQGKNGQVTVMHTCLGQLFWRLKAAAIVVFEYFVRGVSYELPLMGNTLFAFEAAIVVFKYFICGVSYELPVHE